MSNNFILLITSFALSHFATAAEFVPCFKDPKKQEARSLELQQIVDEDQADRIPPIDWTEVSLRDERRRKRVAEIFAEGCFHKAENYAAAALVFQHGDVPEHFYQAFLWAKKAMNTGRPEQSHLMANAIDRYLISKGFKQLFAGQTYRPKPKRCVCLAETELNFPDELRIQYTGRSLQQILEQVRQRNSDRPECMAEKLYCRTSLKTPPRGGFPGIW